jgi:polysaccharide pyruvyl transferase WcaK-like protein
MRSQLATGADARTRLHAFPIPRIGLLTYHRSVNDGSVMQAWCLYKILEHALPGTQIEIIDYIPESLHHRHVRLAFYGGRPPFINPRYVWSYHNQQAFLRRECRYSSQRIVSDDLGQAQYFIERLGYRAVVIGSDTCWELERQPRPPNIYFRPINTVPTFAFAASADPVPGPGSPWYGKADIKRTLDRFEIITVRDEATRNFVQRSGIASDRIGFMPDPTLLYDFSDHLQASRPPRGNGLPLAGLAASPPLAKALHPHVEKAGFQVLSLMGSRQLDSVLTLPMLTTIRQRLGLYPWLGLTITDRFHMTIFALKHGRGPVIFLEDAERWPEPTSKGRDLLTRLGLEQMVWRLDASSVAANILPAMLAAWPEISRGLAERLATLRSSAEATGFAGIVTALQATLATRGA